MQTNMLQLRSPLCPELQDSDFREAPLGFATLEQLYGLVTGVAGEVRPGKSASVDASDVTFSREGDNVPSDLLDIDVSLEELSPQSQNSAGSSGSAWSEESGKCGRRYPFGFDGHTISSPCWGEAEVFHQKCHRATLSPDARTFRGTRSTAVLLPTGARLLGLALRDGRLHLRVFHTK